MRRPTLAIPLVKQPPVYFIVTVVLAALVPVALQLSGAASAAPHPPGVVSRVLPGGLSSGTTELAATTRFAAAWRLPAIAPEPIVILDEVAVLKASPAPAPTADLAGATPPVAARGPMARAKAACRQGDRGAARDAYRKIPRGDARRRDARRACREQGVLLL